MSANISKASRIIGTSALVAFLAFSGFTAFSVNHISTTVDETIAQIDTTPALETSPGATNSFNDTSQYESNQIAQAPQYGQAARINQTTVEDPTVENLVDSAFAAPLGATATRPSVIDTARFSAAITASDNAMTVSIIAITVALGVFSLALIAYLIISRLIRRKKY